MIIVLSSDLPYRPYGSMATSLHHLTETYGKPTTPFSFSQPGSRTAMALLSFQSSS